MTENKQPGGSAAESVLTTEAYREELAKLRAMIVMRQQIAQKLVRGPRDPPYVFPVFPWRRSPVLEVSAR